MGKLHYITYVNFSLMRVYNEIENISMSEITQSQKNTLGMNSSISGY